MVESTSCKGGVWAVLEPQRAKKFLGKNERRVDVTEEQKKREDNGVIEGTCDVLIDVATGVGGTALDAASGIGNAALEAAPAVGEAALDVVGAVIAGIFDS